MKDYKRLTMCGTRFNEHCLRGGICKAPNCFDCDIMLQMFERLGKLEDKITLNKIIELPCKVGDKVYRKDGSWVVVGFECNRANGWKVKLERWKNRFLDCHETTKVVFSSFGKTVFLTKSEAEKKFYGE